MGVLAIKEHRYNDTTRQWELLVAWRGLEDVEDSWEPLQTMQHDVSVLVEQYITTHETDDLQAHLAEA